MSRHHRVFRLSVIDSVNRRDQTECNRSGRYHRRPIHRNHWASTKQYHDFMYLYEDPETFHPYQYPSIA